MKILCTGDLHLGRRSSRLPNDVDQAPLSCVAAWIAIVDYAIAQQVDLVAISGDLVDQDNRFFEAIGPLEKGLRRLHDAGIPAVAVTGNHDYLVLPSLARSLPDGCLRLLGVGGTWERATFTSRDGRRTLHVDGWSFPVQHVRDSPLAMYALETPNDAPVLGLLHGDLDAPGSAYAPLSHADLRARKVDLWLLGHVHAPVLHAASGGAMVLYPGSPQPMDPGEAGVHGAWLVDLTLGQPAQPRIVPLASVRYASIDISMDGAVDLVAARERIVAGVRAAAESIAGERGPLRHLSLRVRLTGRSAVHREIDAQRRAIAQELGLEIGDVRVHVERIESDVRPAHDLERLAAGNNALGLLARLIRDLDAGDESALPADLLRAIGAAATSLQDAKPYRALPFATEDLGPAVQRQMLAQQTSLLLDELTAQKGVAA